MQENHKNVSTVNFLRLFGAKITAGESMPVQDDICDQRAPVNDPQALYEQFVVPDDMMDELDNEKIEDFDNDIYDYEDRTDYGVDIAAAADLSLKRSVEKLKNKKGKAAENKEQVIPGEDEESEA